jgi:hypothetical protein
MPGSKRKRPSLRPSGEQSRFSKDSECGKLPNRIHQGDFSSLKCGYFHSHSGLKINACSGFFCHFP